MLSKLWSGHPVGWQEWGPLLQAFIAFAWIIYGAESWLDVRQHKLFDVKKKPAELTYVQQDEFDKAQKCTCGGTGLAVRREGDRELSAPALHMPALTLCHRA